MKSSNSVLQHGWPMLLFMLFAVVPNTFTTTLLAPGLSYLAGQLGGGAEGIKRAQMLVTVPGIGMLFAPFVGWVADRIGRKWVLVSSLSIITLGGIGCAFTDEFALLLTFRFLLGVGAGGLMSVILSLIGDLYSGEARTKLLGYQQAIMSLFVLGAIQLAGYLSSSYGWSSPLYAYLVGIPLIIFVILRVRPEQRQIAPQESIKIATVPWVRDRSTPVLVLALIGNIFLAIVTYNVFTQLPFLVAEKGYSPSVYANLMAPKLACSIMFSFIFIYLHKKMHPLAIISLSLILSSVSMMTFSFATETYQLWIAAIIGGPSTVMLEPAITNFLLDKMPPARRAMTMGGVFASYHMGPFLIPFVFGGMNSNYGFAASFQALSVAAGLAALILIIGVRAQFFQKHKTAAIM